MKRLITVVVLAVLALLPAAPVAWAHTELTASDPAEGSQVATAPSQLTLTFSEPVNPATTTVKVTAADGTTWAVGTITATDATLTVPVTPAGPAGEYTIDYSIVSADGDPVSGAVKFTLTTAVQGPPPTTATTVTTEPPPPASEDPAPAAQSADAGDGGLPVWVWVVLGGAVVAMVVVAVLVRRSGTRS